MSIWSRALLVMKIKSRAALDKVEDPREVLGYVDEQQQELLRRVKQGMIEVAISKRQLQQQVQALKPRISRLEDQARRALAAGRQDLARIALERKQTAIAELSGLEEHVAEVDKEQERLSSAERQLADRIEKFRIHRKTVTARLTAAEAQVRVTEALSGVSQEFSDLGIALGRAEEKIERMLAHASAIDDLTDTGALSISGSEGDFLERELREVAERDAVDENLAILQADLDTKQALKAGEPEGSSSETRIIP